MELAYANDKRGSCVSATPSPLPVQLTSLVPTTTLRGVN